jgi:hypothetical protein
MACCISHQQMALVAVLESNITEIHDFGVAE